MDETQTDEPVPEKLETAPVVTGMEINLGDFTRTVGLVKSLRLTLDNQIVVQVEEIASGVPRRNLDLHRNYTGNLEHFVIAAFTCWDINAFCWRLR